MKTLELMDYSDCAMNFCFYITLLLRSFFKFMINPLSISFILLGMSGIFYKLNKRKSSKVLIFLFCSWFVVISTPFVPRYLIRSLEKKTKQLMFFNESFQDTTIHILVLGSSYEFDESLSSSSQLSLTALGRNIEAIRLHNIFPSSSLIFSGYANSQPYSQAQISSLSAQELGVNKNCIKVLPEPWNTKSEATTYKSKYGSNHKLYLVTDASHMPRALYHFNRIGLHPTPAPTNFLIKKNSNPKRFSDFLPSSHYIRFMEICIQEYVGIIWGKIGGN